MFRPNPNFLNELREQPETRVAVVAKAEAIKPMVEAEKHSIMPHKGSRPVVIEEDGDEVRLVNTDHGAHLDEWGSVHNAPSAPLRRAVRAAGLRLEEHGD